MRASRIILTAITTTLLCLLQAATSSSQTAQDADAAGIEWVRIPGGQFAMGSDAGDADEKPVHKVRIKDFFLAKSPVTQEQWKAIMKTSPSLQTNCDDCPVTNVSWTDAQLFLQKAGALTGDTLRLPTEAEWEYAAGGGEVHQTWAGTNSPADAQNYGWFSINSSRRAQPVCKKQPNLFGLCDMSGNVWEWCSDWYDSSGYRNSADTDPKGPATGEDRVLRGGCWASPLTISRVTQRYYSWPNAQTPYNGFRPAKDAP